MSRVCVGYIMMKIVCFIKNSDDIWGWRRYRTECDAIHIRSFNPIDGISSSRFDEGRGVGEYYENMLRTSDIKTLSISGNMNAYG